MCLRPTTTGQPAAALPYLQPVCIHLIKNKGKGYQESSTAKFFLGSLTNYQELLCLFFATASVTHTNAAANTSCIPIAPTSRFLISPEISP